MKRIFQKIYNFFAYLSMTFMALIFLLLFGYLFLGMLGFALVLGFAMMVREQKTKELQELKRINLLVQRLSEG